MITSHLTLYGSCLTRYSVGFVTVYDALRRETRKAMVLENGKRFQTITYETRELAVIAARAIAQIRTAVYAECGANNWPLVQGTNGETRLICPVCGKSECIMSVQYPAYGSGPGGGGRLGDSGARDTIRCNSRGHFDGGFNA